MNPLTEECPCRVELWDDEVDTIRRIDVESQRSVEDLSEIEIYPAAEVFMTEDTAVITWSGKYGLIWKRP